MILERAKEMNYAEAGKTKQFCQLPNDLCSKVKQMNLRDSRTPETKDQYLNLKCQATLNSRTEKDAVNIIGEQLNNIKLSDAGKKSEICKSQDNELNEILKNIGSDRDDAQNKEVQNLRRNIVDDDTEQLSNDDNDDKEQVSPEVRQENCDEQKDELPDSPFVQEDVNKEHSECENKSEEGNSNEAKKPDNALCPRAPVHRNSNINAAYHPYTLCSNYHQSRGTVFVAEPVGPTGYVPMPQNNAPTYNITPNIPEPVAPPLQTYSDHVNIKEAEDLTDDEAKRLMWEILKIHHPVIDSFLDGCKNDLLTQDVNQDRICSYPLSDSGDEGHASCESDLSPVGSPQGVVCQRPPQSTSVDTYDSGVVSPKSSPPTPTEYPQPTTAGDSHTFVSDRTTFVTERTKIWVTSVQGHQVPEKSKYRPILPKPESVKTRFAEKLNQDWKLRAWAKIWSLSSNQIVLGDEKDGDTKLMIAVCNEFDGQIEFIYAMVERMRGIPDSLAKVNNAGVSALYLACKFLPEKPLVAAYIAEALMEQNIDVAKLSYYGLTLPQMLQKEGSTHSEVLKELLSVKDSSGRYIFSSYCDANGKI